MSLAPQPQPLDAERQAVQQRLERAVGEGRLTLDEFTGRCALVWSAGDAGQLERVLADLPAPVVGQRQARRSHLVSILGDVRRSGRWSMRRRTTAWLVIGDLDVDLRGAVLEDGDTVEIDVYSALGDATVVVPEGVEVELGGFSVIGDRKVALAPVPRVPGTPTVRVRVFSLIGDARIRSAR